MSFLFTGCGDIEVVVLSAFISIMEGYVSSIPLRVMLFEKDILRVWITLHQGQQTANNGSSS
jgi:hypothetical protein